MQTLDHLPLSALKGAGAATLARLEKLGVSSVLDLLLHVPLRYEDRSRLTALGALQAGASAKVCGQVQLAEITPRGRRSLVCRLGDGTGHVYLRFFHFNARQVEHLA
ncbi:MAG TPA: ATP-dependent DNA helicase RecG, partial [Methylococcaceae bacterium]|nr:ATP-dependent DNA helicase RecG [Methylococcaceae bacterium]